MTTLKMAAITLLCFIICVNGHKKHYRIADREDEIYNDSFQDVTPFEENLEFFGSERSDEEGQNDPFRGRGSRRWRGVGRGRWFWRPLNW